MEIQPINSERYEKPLIPQQQEKTPEPPKKHNTNKTHGANVDKLV